MGTTPPTANSRLSGKRKSRFGTVGGMKRAIIHLPRLTGLIAVSLAALLLTAVTRASNAAQVMTPQMEAICGTPEVDQMHTLRVKAAPLRLVAVGSSSTEGVGASRPALSYVSQLGTRLGRDWPTSTVVINKGVSGNVLSDIVARAPRDVFALNPNVVVVQTGTNDAMQNVPVARYQRQLQQFVDRLQARHIRVILVDNQYLPAQVGSAEYIGIQKATHDVAHLNHVSLVSRYGLSEAIQAQTHMQPGDLLAADGFHPNDLMHACTARAIEVTLLGALGAQSTL